MSSTPSSTPSLSATPSSSQTPTLSVTPSSTPVPDVLIRFNVLLVPIGTTVTASYMASLTTFAASSAASFASLLGVSATSVYLSNITDIATGLIVELRQSRRLTPAGSLGLSLIYVVNLGKTPQEVSVLNMTATLAALTPASPVVVSVRASVAAATHLDLSAFTLSVDTMSVTLANAAFVLPTTGPSSSSSSSSGGSSTGAIVGGILGVTALFCAIWSWRSYAKHGKLPCFRDRAKEKREALEQAYARNNSGGGGGGDVEAANPLGGESALTIRHLAKQVADRDAEMKRLASLVAAEKAVSNALKEGRPVPQVAIERPQLTSSGIAPVAGVGLKAQLRAEEAAKKAVARAAFSPEATSKD